MSLVLNEIVETACMTGLSYEDAWDATPKELGVVTRAWHKAVAVSAWTNGVYFAAAIGVSFSKNAKYPENPLVEFENEVDPDMELTEEEQEYWRKRLMANFDQFQRSDNEDE